MAIVNTNTSPLLSEGTSITLSQSGQIITVNASVTGVQDLWIQASDMYPTTTSGCATLTQNEFATSLANINTLDFNQTTSSNAQFVYSFPRNWDLGTVAVKFYWTASSGTGGVIWGIKARAYSNDDALTVALGTEVTVTDTLIAANDMHVTDYTSALTIAGTPADGDLIVFNIARKTASQGDNLTASAKLIGISIKYTTDSATAE
jgi:hypothetical protein